VDDVVVLQIPATFHNVASFYGEFKPLTDEDVIAYFEKMDLHDEMQYA